MPSQYNLGEFDKIYDSDYFLKAYNSNNFIKDLGNVVVIGGGNICYGFSKSSSKNGSNNIKCTL